MSKPRLISIPSVVIPCLAIFLVSLLLQPSAHAAPTTQDDDPAALCAEGVQLFFDGKAAEAFPLLEEGFAERESATFADPDGEGRCALALGRLRDRTGNRSSALSAYQIALDIFQANGNRELEGSTLNNIGLVYSNQGKYAEALDSYQQALDITREVGNRAGFGTTLNNIGAIYHAQGKYAEALDSYQQALDIRREVGDRAGFGTTLNNIGGAAASTTHKRSSKPAAASASSSP